MRTKQEPPAFKIEDRGFTCTCWYLDDTPESKGVAQIEIVRDGATVKEFLFPAYKIWNIAAHFRDIVDSELDGDARGYQMAASTGFGGSVAIQETKGRE